MSLLGRFVNVIIICYQSCAPQTYFMQTDPLFKLKKHIERVDLVCIARKLYALLVLRRPSVRENEYGLGSRKHLQLLQSLMPLERTA